MPKTFSCISIIPLLCAHPSAPYSYCLFCICLFIACCFTQDPLPVVLASRFVQLQLGYPHRAVLTWLALGSFRSFRVAWRIYHYPDLYGHCFCLRSAPSLGLKSPFGCHVHHRIIATDSGLVPTRNLSCRWLRTEFPYRLSAVFFRYVRNGRFCTLALLERHLPLLTFFFFCLVCRPALNNSI